MAHSIKFSLKTICAAIFDCSTVLLFASTLFRLLLLFLSVKRFAIILLVCLLYYTFFYVYRQQTLGQSAFGIALITKDKKRPTLVQIFIRVFTKAMIFFIIPTSLLVYINPTFLLTLFSRCLLLLSLYFSLIIIVLIVFKLLFKQNVWNLLSRTKKIDTMYSKQKFAFSFLVLLCFTTCCWTCIFVWNNSDNPSKRSILGFSYPFKYIEPPSNHLTQPYINYFLISANTPFSLRRVPQGRAEVMPVDEKCGCSAYGSTFCRRERINPPTQANGERRNTVREQTHKRSRS